MHSNIIIIGLCVPFIVLQHNSSDQLRSLWDEYDKSQVIIERLRDLQGHLTPNMSRTEKILSLEKWLQDNGAVYINAVRVGNSSVQVSAGCVGVGGR